MSFRQNVLPLFSADDIKYFVAIGMKVDNYDWISIKENALAVYHKLYIAPVHWSQGKVVVFKAWIDYQCPA